MLTLPLLNPKTLDAVTTLLAVAMALCALGIVSVGAIQRMIQFYRLQSVILALLTGLVALAPARANAPNQVLLAAFALLIPGMLAYIIEPLLAQATVPREAARSMRLGRPVFRVFSIRYQEEARAALAEAAPVWLEYGLSSSRQATSAVVSLLLIASAYVVAGALRIDPNRMHSLAVALALLMLGIFTMINRQDLISQIMGLLVMDHGLFLAAVRVVPHPALIPILVVCLFLYILITLVILVILLPELHDESKTIEVAGQNELRG